MDDWSLKGKGHLIYPGLKIEKEIQYIKEDDIEILREKLIEDIYEQSIHSDSIYYSVIEKIINKRFGVKE